MRAALLPFFLLWLAGLVACDRGPFTEGQTLGGRAYGAGQLNRGFRHYQKACRACHGDAGDGHGLSAPGLWPPPRDLTQGLFKFGRVPAPGLPPDAELARILRGGLDGTGMLPWTLGDDELVDLLGYLKTLSPRWRAEVPAEAVTASPDPYAALGPGALEPVLRRGEAIYHGKSMCSTCHPAYVTRARLYEITRELTGTGVTAYTPEMYTSRIKDTEHCLRRAKTAGPDGERACEEPVRSIPTDFLHDQTRAVRKATAALDLYLTLAAGIGGAGMPPWKGALSEDELWSLAYYVRSLIERRGTTAGDALFESLRAAENVGWQPPAP